MQKEEQTALSTDIAISLGTSKTRIYIEGHGIVLSEPSVVSVDLETERIIAVGRRAYEMVGRTSNRIKVIFPLEGGVISDFYLVEGMLDYFLKRVSSSKIVMPRAVACVPGEITDVEKRAVVNTISMVGIRKVCLIEKPVAAALGAGIDLENPTGQMIVNTGGGTSDIAVLSLNGAAVSRSIKIGGNKMDEQIIKYVRKKYNMLIGKRMAEDAKIAIGCVYPKEKEEFYRLKGRDSITGMPKWIDFSSEEMMEAIIDSANQIVSEIQDVLEEAPPELAGDVYENGITFTGGTAKLYGFGHLIARKTRLKVRVAEDPENCIVLGAGIATKYMNELDKKEYGVINPLTAEY